MNNLVLVEVSDAHLHKTRDCYLICVTPEYLIVVERWQEEPTYIVVGIKWSNAVPNVAGMLPSCPRFPRAIHLFVLVYCKPPR